MDSGSVKKKIRAYFAIPRSRHKVHTSWQLAGIWIRMGLLFSSDNLSSTISDASNLCLQADHMINMYRQHEIHQIQGLLIKEYLT